MATLATVFYFGKKIVFFIAVLLSMKVVSEAAKS